MNSTVSGQPSETAIISYVTLKHAACYTIASCTFLVLYDTVLTLGQEVNTYLEVTCFYYYSAPSAGISMFYTRTALLHQSLLIFSIGLGVVAYKTEWKGNSMMLYQLLNWYAWLTNVFVHLAIQVYIYAVFNKNRPLTFGLGVAFTVLTLVQCAANVISTSNLRVVETSPVCVTIHDTIPHDLSLDETLMRAAAQRMHPLLTSTILCSMAFSLFLLALLAYKSWITFRPKPMRAHDLAAILVRDSAAYFLMILVLTIYNSLLITIAPSEIIQAGVAFEIALPSIASSRLLLNLRAADKRRKKQTDVDGIPVDQWETMFHIT
ncbi:hypothetical protein EUX98_g5753 [Antrodiella citrinella]|uniref:Uncharacterized protein n=1 Tax=Antrodiella citrinella TaxID=2447956 RepID=A0A4S4MQT5_9APHY|nr:hypothetical protein EUX98_g5753 [Antrodiella citrinella]